MLYGVCEFIRSASISGVSELQAQILGITAKAISGCILPHRQKSQTLHQYKFPF